MIIDNLGDVLDRAGWKRLYPDAFDPDTATEEETITHDNTVADAAADAEVARYWPPNGEDHTS